jgi:hypothetical protein
MSATLNEHDYLVQIDHGRYLVSIDVGKGEVEITNIPSFAAHFAYVEADRTAVGLRRRGFRQSVVCSPVGVPVSANDLHAVLAAQDAQANDLPRSRADLDRIPAGEMKRRMKSESVFAKRVSELYAKQSR